MEGIKIRQAKTVGCQSIPYGEDDSITIRTLHKPVLEMYYR
jgi:hypothetical protein